MALHFNTLRPRQNGCHFTDDIFKCIFLNENVSILIKMSLKFIPEGPINNIPALVQIMAWRRPGDRPLSESMVFSLLMHICVTQCQWVNWSLDFLYARLKNGRIMPWQCPSVRLSVCPSVRPIVRPSVRVFRTFLQHALRYQFETWYIHSVGGTTCRVWVASQLVHFDLVYSQK